VDVGFDAVEFAQQDGFGVDRVAGVDEVLGGADRQVVHHLQAAGNDAGGDDVGHCAAGLFDRVEAGQQHPATWGLGSSLTVTSVMIPSMPSEPVNSASRSKPGVRASLPRVRRSPRW
jgi:hypothetical protein